MRTSRIYIPRTKQTKGFTPDVQYAAVNEARSKRSKRRERNQRMIFSGGYKQVPILHVK